NGLVIELCFGLCLAVLHSLFYPLLLSYRGSSCVDSSVDAVALHSVGFHPTFSRHGIAQSLSALALLIWLNEKVLFFIFSTQLPHSPISRFGIRGGDRIGLCGGLRLLTAVVVESGLS
ncbi:MAG: hypothetical protein U0L68_04860, partial [Prevotellamassilia sp.]|nr:hypothetical protein [Prevotellamassilia sp.]